MKRRNSLLTFLLVLTLVASSLLLTSCEEGTKIESIGGKAPAEVYSEALAVLEEERNYEIEIDMEFDIKVIGIPVYGVDIDDFCIYAYDGENEYYKLSENAEPTLAKYGMESIVSKSDDAVWYVDGVCYVNKDGNKRSFTAEKSPLKRSKYETAITEVVEENIGTVQCYTDGERNYFVIEIEDTASMKLGMGAEKETYTVYLTSDGKLDEIVVECKVKTVGVINLDVDYSYGEAKINPPADASEYKAS